jgi:hypothetical protein
MCPNQILFDEQIALIGCNTSNSSVHMLRHRRQLAITQRLLRAYPYPHRPYDPSVGGPAGKAGQASRVSAISPLQRGTR